MVVTSQNGKTRRNWSIGTTSVHVHIPIIRYVNNKFQIIRHVNNKELITIHMAYQHSYQKFINLSYGK
jgi:hypothetical protein